jgi:NAD(P)H dehydrogenase (quinone)
MEETMTLLVTAASGHLGRLVVEALLDSGTRASDIVATSRRPEAISDLVDRGVEVRSADYDDPASLDTAFVGVDRLLLVSGTDAGRRTAQHRNAIEAAQRAGVGFVAYTSILHAATSELVLAQEHRETEQVLADSGLPHTFLRNSWYLENYTGQVPGLVERGVLLGAAGDGRVSAATRADFAAAAAAVLTGEGHEGKVYELGADRGFTMAEFAAVVARASGHEVVYEDLSVDDLTQALVAAGLPHGYAAALADGDRGIREGALFTDSGDLGRLIGRPTTSVEDAVRVVV